MKINELRSFLEIASLGSFSKAAGTLNYAHSSITAQIKSLEGSLGERLFTRNNKRVELTEAGKRLHKYARQIVDLSREAKDTVLATPKLSGCLTIAAVETISTYRLPRILRKFRETAPNVHIAFKVMRDQEVLESAKIGTIDFGFLVEEELVMRDVEVLKLCNEKVSLYVGPDHPLAKIKDLKAEGLAAHHHLLWSLECCYSSVYCNIMQKSGFHDFSYMEFSNTETMKQCAISDLGIALLTDVTAVKECASGELVKLDFTLEDRFKSFMFWNKYRAVTPAHLAFIEAAKPE
jgi:DNA-binding transcriptional LysR family regulator